MIRCLILAFCVNCINSQGTSSYNYDDEYKMLLFEVAGVFGNTRVAVGVDTDVNETISLHNYTAHVWPVNTTIFAGREVFFLREQISRNVVRKGLMTLYRLNTKKVILDRYNFTTGVIPPDDPTGSEFFVDLTMNSISHLPKCNGSLYILERRGTAFIGGLHLCELDAEYAPKYTFNIWCDRIILWSMNSKGPYIDFYIYPKARRTFPPKWGVPDTCQDK